MDDRQRASQWVAMYADNNALARHRQAVDSLTALLDSVRREALEEAARAVARLQVNARDASDIGRVIRELRALASATTETKSHT